jgi:MFS family permease
MLAWYILFGTIGVAVGTIVAGKVVHHLQADQRWAPVDSYRVVFWAYAVIGLVNFCLSLVLSTKSETQEKRHTDNLPNNDESRPLLPENAIDAHEADTNPYNPLSFLKPLLPFLSRESQSLVFKLCLLFAIDSIASGLTPASLVTYFFNRKFDLKEDKLGALFFSTNVISSASNLVASSIARRIGFIKTMVFTHVPASVALALIPLPSNVIAAMTLLIFRSSTNSMDQAPRQAFLAAAVLPSERTAVMGIVNVVKTLSQSLGPVATGALAGRGKFWIAFVISGGLKIVYDILMLAMFLGYRTQEERAQEQDTEAEEAEREDSVDETGSTPA